MSIVHAARRTGYTLQVQFEPEGRWIDLIPTRPSVLAQGFVSTDDEGDGLTHRLLSDPNDPQSEPMEVEAVVYCPQAAAMLTQADNPGLAKLAILDVPELEEAEDRLQVFKLALLTRKKDRDRTKRR